MTDLTETVEGAWARLYQSAEVRDAGFRMGQLATIGLSGSPRLRTIVLRAATFEHRTVRFHTDTRSPKIAELRANNAVSLVCYSSTSGEQIRVEGHATLHHQNDIARAAWVNTIAQSRVCYRTPFAAGASLSSADEADTSAAMRNPDDADFGFENFCAVVVSVRRLDWLDLAASGHRRAVFEWDDEAWRGNWVAP